MSLAYRPSLISIAFKELLGAVQLTAPDTRLFESYRASIRATLAQGSGFALNRVEPIGSYSRGTAVRGTSDVDVLALIASSSVSTGGWLQTSTTVLSKFRATLAARFWQTDVARDGQAIVVDFGDGSHPVDVVPAIWKSQTGFNNYPVYLIPNGSGDWMPTSPTGHNRFIQGADARSGGKLTYAAQIAKYWCATRAAPVPLSGFHVELLLASSGLCDGPRSYSSITRDLFALLARRSCAALNDPVGVSGRIAAASSDAKRDSVQRSVHDALDHADRAVHAESVGDDREALRQWNIVFNGCFTR